MSYNQYSMDSTTTVHQTLRQIKAFQPIFILIFLQSV